MLYKITNKGEARTVTHLGVFAKGETRDFSQEDLEMFQHMSGVPVFSSVLSDPDEFDVVVFGDDKKEG